LGQQRAVVEAAAEVCSSFGSSSIGDGPSVTASGLKEVCAQVGGSFIIGGCCSGCGSRGSGAGGVTDPAADAAGKAATSI